MKYLEKKTFFSKVEKLTNYVFLEDEVFRISEFIEHQNVSLEVYKFCILSFKIKDVSKMSVACFSPLNQCLKFNIFFLV